MPGCVNLIDPFLAFTGSSKFTLRYKNFFAEIFFFILNANMFLKNKKRANWSNNIVKTKMYNFY